MGTVNAGVFDNLTQLDAASAPADTSGPPVDASAPPPDAFQSATLVPDISLLKPARPVFSTPAIYITQDDSLQLTAWNSAAALTSLTLQVRFLKTDGTIGITSATLQNLTADRTANFLSIGQLEGFILGVVVGPPGVSVLTGQCWVTISLIRGTAAAPLMVQLLTADYLSRGFQPGWPTTSVHSPVDGPGLITHAVGFVGGAGSEATLSVPTNARWRMQSIQIQFVTSAAAGNRQVVLQGEVSGGLVWRVPAPAVQPPSSTFNYTFAPGLQTIGTTPSAQLITLPEDVFLSVPPSITTLTTGLQAGDIYAPPVAVVEEWIDV